MATLDQDQQEWVEQYAGKMMTCWHHWQGPLGIDENYKQDLTRQLAACFPEPLKRDLIERTY